MIIRPASPADHPALVDLLRTTMGWPEGPEGHRLWQWKHVDSPFGPSVMWMAEEGGRPIGVRPFMRWEFERGSSVVRAARAVDTATHPDHQGKGVFSALTRAALDELRGDGVQFVFNTPNSQSLPGYLKLGWTKVGRLPVAVRPSSPGGRVANDAFTRARRAGIPRHHGGGSDQRSAGLRAARQFARRPSDRPGWPADAAHRGVSPMALRPSLAQVPSDSGCTRRGTWVCSGPPPSPRPEC